MVKQELVVDQELRECVKAEVVGVKGEMTVVQGLQQGCNYIGLSSSGLDVWGT